MHVNRSIATLKTYCFRNGEEIITFRIWQLCKISPNIYVTNDSLEDIGRRYMNYIIFIIFLRHLFLCIRSSIVYITGYVGHVQLTYLQGITIHIRNLLTIICFNYIIIIIQGVESLQNNFNLQPPSKPTTSS